MSHLHLESVPYVLNMHPSGNCKLVYVVLLGVLVSMYDMSMISPAAHMHLACTYQTDPLFFRAFLWQVGDNPAHFVSHDDPSEGIACTREAVKRPVGLSCPLAHLCALCACPRRHSPRASREKSLDRIK